VVERSPTNYDLVNSLKPALAAGVWFGVVMPL
jgi:hypothetical protein